MGQFHFKFVLFLFLWLHADVLLFAQKLRAITETMLSVLIALCLVGQSFTALHDEDTPPSLAVRGFPFGAIEHVNLNMGMQWDERLSAFWFDVLRCSSDSRAQAVLEVTNAGRLARGDPPMGGLTWVNVGLQQFHLPTGDVVGAPASQTLRGVTVLSWPPKQIPLLRQRLTQAGYNVTSFHSDALGIVGPFNNRFLFEAGSTAFGPVVDAGEDIRDSLPGGPSEGLGIRALRFDVGRGTAHHICSFYRTIFHANSTQDDGHMCAIEVGFGQSLEFVESDLPLPAYQGEHVALYIADGDVFRESYVRACQFKLVFNNQRSPHLVYDTYEDVQKLDEFRFKDIIHPETGQLLYELEHEIRSLNHQGFLLDHRLQAPTPIPANFDAHTSLRLLPMQ